MRANCSSEPLLCIAHASASTSGSGLFLGELHCRLYALLMVLIDRAQLLGGRTGLAQARRGAQQRVALLGAR